MCTGLLGQYLKEDPVLLLEGLRTELLSLPVFYGFVRIADQVEIEFVVLDDGEAWASLPCCISPSSCSNNLEKMIFFRRCAAFPDLTAETHN